MSNLREAAFLSLKAAQAEMDGIPDVLTVQAIENIKSAMRAVIHAQWQAVKWLDAVEI